MKKLVITVLMGVLFSLMTTEAYAAKVGVILDTPLVLMNDTNVQKQIDAKTGIIFPNGKFDVLPAKEGINAMQLYREEHGLTDTTNAANDGLASYQWALKQSEISELGRRMGCDYVLLLRVFGNGKSFAGTYAREIDTTLLTDVRIFNIAQNKYTFMETKVNVSKDKKYMKSLVKAFSECLKKLQIDTAKI